MKLTTLSLAGLLLAGTVQSASADVGAGLGAILGGATGAIIGHQSNEAAAGAAVGAVAGAIIGHTLDRAQTPTRHAVEYRQGRPSWDRPPPRTVVIHDRQPVRRPVIVHTPRPQPVVVIVESTPPPPTVIVRQSHSPVTVLADEHGYTSADYLALMQPAEITLLRQRAYGLPNIDLTAYLTPQEKGNLRARAANQVVIGG